MEVLSQILETLMAILSGWLVLMLVYQLSLIHISEPTRH